MALTATASPQVKRDIVNALCIPQCKQFVMSFNRPNLNYEVRQKVATHKEALVEIVEYINTRHRGDAGIIYIQSVQRVEEYATKLQQEYGISARPYHADLSTAMKDKIQNDWQIGRVKVIVATVNAHLGVY